MAANFSEQMITIELTYEYAWDAKFREHIIAVFSVENEQNRQHVLENRQKYKINRQIMCRSEVSVSCILF